MDEIIYGINIEEIERITGEDQKIIKKWKKGTRPIPESSLVILTDKAIKVVSYW